MNRDTVEPARRVPSVRAGLAVRSRTAVSAGLLASAVLLAGCSSSSGPAPGASASAGASAGATASADVSPAPTSTLSAEEQQAFEEATAVVLAYRQTITDLYSGARTNLNDLNDVATGDLVDQGLTNIQQSLNEGWSRAPNGTQLVLRSAEPVAVRLEEKPQALTIRACIDASDVTILAPDGDVSRGVREVLDYTVIRTEYLPDPGWAVSRVSTESESALERRC